jgi:hypothetical protein
VKGTAALAVAALVIAWLWASGFGWFDVTRFCRIAIDVDLLEGDRSAVRAAIDLVRREDPAAYRALCRWIDRIQEEHHCQAGDPSADPEVRRAQWYNVATLEPTLRRSFEAPACYVRGSRIIVLRRPRTEDARPTLVRARAEALKRLAVASQTFWTSGPR